MRLTVKNLGVISKASVDLSKDLIILTGENDTGKTYVSYVVYGLNNLDYANPVLRLDEGLSSHVEKEKSTGAINLHEMLLARKEDFRHWLEKALEDQLSRLLALDAASQAQVSIHDISFETSKSSLNKVVSFEANDLATVEREITSTVLQAFFHRTFIFPAERQGIALFNKELSVIKAKTFDELLKNGGKKEFLDLARLRFNRYAGPIQENLRIAQDLEALQNEKSDFAHLADEFEQNLVGGKISVSSLGDLQFTPNGASITLDIHLASSSVKSLASLAFYLRHLAQKNDFIIIDEPEANLHPNNQLKIARFLARLVNEGFKVMVSTHSDYIMRELNTLIMLGTGKKKEPQTTKDLMKRYHYNENELLQKEQVGVYLFRVGKDVEEVKIEEDGFEVATIDETVDRMNESSQNIYFELFD